MMNHSTTILAAGFVAALMLFAIPSTQAAERPPDTRCYEMRIYYAHEGKLEALHQRFREHTLRLFEKHGIVNVGYWVPIENPDRKLIFILAFPSLEAREKHWQAFVNDPEWRSAFKASEADGPLVARVETVFLHTTDYSPVPARRAARPGR